MLNLAHQDIAEDIDPAHLTAILEAQPSQGKANLLAMRISRNLPPLRRMKVRFTRRAHSDLRIIADYLVERSPTGALNVRAALSMRFVGFPNIRLQDGDK